jgi:hypothetical protein
MYLESGIALPETDLNLLKEGYQTSVQNINTTYGNESKPFAFSFED